ncbi:MAG: hypothetical protein R2882_10180 [Gemmatimonadales bacterium]
MLREGFEVRVVDNLSTGDERNLAHGPTGSNFSAAISTRRRAGRREGRSSSICGAPERAALDEGSARVPSAQRRCDRAPAAGGRDAKVRRIVFCRVPSMVIRRPCPRSRP